MTVQQRTSFVGRVDDLASAARLLADNRLLTLTGPGGVGKTRLALALAEREAHRFAGGVHAVSLAPVADAALVGPAISAALGVRLAGDDAPLAAVVALLRDQSVLLVLDNFEQVVDAAPIVAELLTQCPALTVLVTSRTSLHLAGEQEYPVPPLALPDLSTGTELDALMRSDAVALFTRRAQQGKPEFRLTPDNAASVAAICRRLDGLPLAIELAAARVKLLTPQVLLTRLDRRLPLLSGGPRDAPARQQTMRDTIAWSYALLAPDQQRLFRQLAVFTSGWTIEAADAVSDPNLDTIEGLAALVDQSLVRPAEQPDGSTRFTMLETIREYGLEQLEAHDEAPAVRRRHAMYVVALTEAIEQELRGADQATWLRVTDLELGNVRAALEWGLEHAPALTLRGAAALRWFWLPRGLLAEGRRWLNEGLRHDETVPPLIQAKALDVAGTLAGWIGDLDDSKRQIEQALAIYRAAQDLSGVATALWDLGRTYQFSGDFQTARRINEEGLVIARELGDPMLEDGLTGNLGVNLQFLGDYDQAAAFMERALDIARAAGQEQGVIIWLFNLADLEVQMRQPQRALERLREGLLVSRQFGEKRFVVHGFESLALIATDLDPRRAARLYGAANALRVTSGYSVNAFHLAEYEENLALARTALGDEQFAAEWEAGRRLTLDEAIDEALAFQLDNRGDVETDPARIAGISTRELDVLRLIVEGKSDREIAAALFISHHTVMRHVSNILGKLGVDSRTAAATYAVRNNLV